MDFVKDHLREVITLLSPFIAWLLARYFKDKARLVYGNKHLFKYLIEQPLVDDSGKILSPTQTVDVISIWVLNVGREKAAKVEVVFNWEPQFINIWPSRTLDKKVMHDRRCSYQFEDLPPKDSLNFELMAINATIPAMVSVRSEAAVAREVTLAPQEVHPNWKIWIVGYLMLAGVAATVFLIATLIQLLAVR
jgi:hypothetical protein